MEKLAYKKHQMSEKEFKEISTVQLSFHNLTFFFN